MISAAHIDLYQLTSLVPHIDAGLGETPVTMSFFSRRLPRDANGQPVRGYLVYAGLRRCLQWLGDCQFDDAHIETILQHQMLGPAVASRPNLLEALRNWRFSGIIDAPLEGTILWPGRAERPDGQLVDVGGVRPSAQLPYLVVQTDLLSAKLIETPLLSIINHMTKVSSKAARIVRAAGERGVLEFGTRRTHPQSAVDSSYCAYLAGCMGTSNLEAHHHYGVPAVGTMDHFAIQAWERDGVARAETELAYFRSFYDVYPRGAILLVDTYDTFGEQTGIRNAVAATNGDLLGIRLDSQLTVENIRAARELLDSLGATSAKIVASGGLDEFAIASLTEAPVDFYGVGERLVTSPDAPVGVGAVGKLCEIDGRPTMKVNKGTGKATLPGQVQVFRKNWIDTVARSTERLDGEPLLHRVWDENGPRGQPTLEDTRDLVRRSLASIPSELLEPRRVTVRITELMYRLVESLAR